jgi:hypothetical protein
MSKGHRRAATKVVKESLPAKAPWTLVFGSCDAAAAGRIALFSES